MEQRGEGWSDRIVRRWPEGQVIISVSGRHTKLGPLLCCIALVTLGHTQLLAADTQCRCIPKELYLIRDRNDITVANIPFSRFDKLELSDQETVQATTESLAVALVVTSSRVLGYGARTPTWRTVKLKRDEQVQKIEAQDFGGLVVTNQRVLSYNGNNGAWATIDR